MLVASQWRTVRNVLSVAVATFVRMVEIDLLERRAGVNTDIVDDVAMLEHLASTEPGPFSMMVLEGIYSSTLDFDGRLAYIKAWERLQRSITARVQHALAEVLVADLPDDDDLIGLEMLPSCLAHSRCSPSARSASATLS